MTWMELIKQELSKPYLKDLKEMVDHERKDTNIFPIAKDVFNVFAHTQPSKVRVVILGQDPYIGIGQADGFAFSTNSRSTPYSLQIIFKELNESYSGMKTMTSTAEDNSLLSWAHQGVMLLNRVLTVREGESKSHSGEGWETFTDRVIDELLKQEQPIVWALWGADAKKALEGKKSIKGNHYFLKTDHPSATRYSGKFLGCGHFIKINQILIVNNIMPINWTRYPKAIDLFMMNKFVPSFKSMKDYKAWRRTSAGRELLFIDNKRLKL